MPSFQSFINRLAGRILSGAISREVEGRVSMAVRALERLTDSRRDQNTMRAASGDQRG